jgi:hypothetical protein
MTDKTETLVREALQRQADRAPSAAALLTRLQARQPRRGPNRLVLAGLTAGIVAVLAVGAVLVAGPGGAGDQTPPAAAPPAHGVLMKWEPHWLPAGMTEKTRMLAPNGTTRIWSDTPVDQTGNTQGPRVWIDESRLETNHSTPSDRTAEGSNNSGSIPGMTQTKVSINGMTGDLAWTPRTRDALVTWYPQPDLAVTARVMGLEHGDDIALRVARSTRPDGTARFSSLISFPNLPKNWGPGSSVRIYGNSPREAQTEVTMSRAIPGDPNGGMVLYAFTLLAGKPIPTPVDGASEPTVLITPAPGLTVALRPDLMPSHNPEIDNKADVARIGKLVHVEHHVDLSWIGTP